MATSVKQKKHSILARFALPLMERLFSEYTPVVREVIVQDNGALNKSEEYSTTKMVNYQLVRQMYRNTNNTYSLAAHLVKPIIDANVSFIGIPTVRSTNKQVLAQIETFWNRLPFNQVHRIAEREGTAFVWPQFDKDGNLRFEIIRPEIVDKILIDPITKEITGFVIVDEFSYKDIKDVTHNVKITITVDKDRIVRKVESDDAELNAKSSNQRNPFGFLPIVIFTNDKEPWELRGHSEIESIEPQLHAYHEVTVQALRAQKRDGHPKMKANVNSVKEFVENNWGEGYYELLRQGKAKLTLDGRDFYMLNTGNGVDGEKEDIGYVEANRSTGEYTSVSEKAFTNIIEGAQTPEIVFGANMGTSLASVKEQRPAYIKRIERKQGQYDKSWKELVVLVLRMMSFISFTEYAYDDFTFAWPTPDFASEKEKAETLNTLFTSLIKGRASNIIGDEEIHSTIKRFDILDVYQDWKEHKKDVKKTAEFIVQHEKDKRAEQNNLMNQRIGNGEYDNTKTGEDAQEETESEQE